MATTGRRTAILAGTCGLAVLAGAVTAFWDDAAIHWHIRQLHAKDEAARDAAAEALAGIGAGVMSRLLSELEQFEDGREPFEYSQWSMFCQSAIAYQASGEPLERACASVVGAIGDPAISRVIGRLDRSNERLLQVLRGMIDRYGQTMSADVGRPALRRGKRLPVPIDGTRGDTRLLGESRQGTAAERTKACLEELLATTTGSREITLAAAEMLEKLKARESAGRAQ